jgi:hypothetical protein
MTQETVRQIEDSIARAKKHIELDMALDRLEANRDFKAVIAEGYLEREAVRLVHLKSDPAMRTPERQASIVTQIDSIGGLLAFFRTVSQNAALASRSIEQDEFALEELRAEELQRG